MCKACGFTWTRIRISRLFYSSWNRAGSALSVSFLLFIQRTGKKRGRQRRGDTWEDSGRITSKTGDTRCPSKTSGSLCSLVKEMLVLSGESVAGVHFILLEFDSRPAEASAAVSFIMNSSLSIYMCISVHHYVPHASIWSYVVPLQTTAADSNSDDIECRRRVSYRRKSSTGQLETQHGPHTRFLFGVFQTLAHSNILHSAD